MRTQPPFLSRERRGPWALRRGPGPRLPGHGRRVETVGSERRKGKISSGGFGGFGGKGGHGGHAHPRVAQGLPQLGQGVAGPCPPGPS